jgi:multimeric flavodoxin WrbA
MAKGMNKVEDMETVLRKLKEVDLNKIVDYDVILLGSLNHFGGPPKSVERFIDKLGETRLEWKMVGCF